MCINTLVVILCDYLLFQFWVALNDVIHAAVVMAKVAVVQWLHVMCVMDLILTRCEVL
jgi:hypothetical protein